MGATAEFASFVAGLRPADLPGISVKKYPCCFATHCALDAALDLRRAHAVEACAIWSVDVVVPQGALWPLIHDRPSTGLEGKFSMQYCVAAALLDGAVRLSSFTDGAVQRASARALMERVRVREEPRRKGALTPFYAEAAIDLAGSARRAFVDTPATPSPGRSWSTSSATAPSPCLRRRPRER